MCGFKTKNSRYLVDTEKRLITGGIFGKNMVRYLKLQAIIGSNGYVTLANGKVIRTGIVERYI